MLAFCKLWNFFHMGELWQDKWWLLHHNNAPANNALSMSENNIGVLEQPPCSPYLAPFDFLHFNKLKVVIKGINIEGVVAIKLAVNSELKDTQEEFFSQCIEA